jgi:flagellar basal body-associated protein FliL
LEQHGADGEVKKKKLPQNTEALLDELEAEAHVTENSEQDAENLLIEIDPNLNASLKDLTTDFANIKDEIQSLELGGGDSVDDSIPFKERLKIRLKHLQKGIKDKFLQAVYRGKYFFIWLFTDGLKKSFYLFVLFGKRIKNGLTVFLNWSLKKKVGFIITFSILGTLTFGFFYVVKNSLLHRESFKFFGSVGEFATYSFNYHPDTQSESFYSSPRVKTYSFQLKPIVINLKRKDGSTRNPMGFFEFVLDGSSGDVLVEVKTRETEIIDIVQRVVESMAYEELDSVEGKLKLKETLRKELNKILIEGSLRKVQIQSIIIKP